MPERIEVIVHLNGNSAHNDVFALIEVFEGRRPGVVDAEVVDKGGKRFATERTSVTVYP